MSVKNPRLSPVVLSSKENPTAALAAYNSGTPWLHGNGGGRGVGGMAGGGGGGGEIWLPERYDNQSITMAAY